MGEKTAYYSKLGINPIYFDNRYELLSTIGRGKSSVVYLTSKISNDETLDIDSPPIALKVLLNTERDPETAIRRIKKESLALLSCVHPSIIRMHDYVAREDACYISMEYAKYGDLKNLLKSNKSFLSPLATLRLTQELLSGIGAIHSAGILHRDIKPENVLLADDYQVKICDFSVCLLKGEKPNLSLLIHVVGTIDYLAPECLSGKGYSVCSDLYATAVTSFELLTGNLPFAARSINESVDKKNRCDLADLPAEILGQFPDLPLFFKKALATNPDDRFASHREMSEAIDRVIKSNLKAFLENQKIPNKKLITSIDKFKVSGKDFFTNSNFTSNSNFNWKIVKNVCLQIKNKLKILGLFFLSSFVATILFIILTNIFVGDMNTDAKALEKTPNQALNKNPDTFEYFSNTSGMGTISDLYTEDRNYRFVLTPISSNKALFVLLVKGWEPVEVDLSELKSGRPLKIEGKGLSILLGVSEISDEMIVKGTYENLVTARMGRWSFVPLKNQ